LFAAFALVACDGFGFSIGANDNGDETPSGDPTEEIDGNLDEGAVIDLDWAHGLYCWPQTEDVKFNGAHVFYEREQDADRDFTMRVKPASTLDVSIYYVQRSDGDTNLPPDITSAFDCDATYEFEDDSNAGQAEVVLATGSSNPYELLIGVAGANGADSGSYTLQIWDEPAEDIFAD
jgi:hypothetical protein